MLRERDLLSTSSLSKWLQQLGLGQAKARRPESKVLHMGDRDPSIEPPTAAFSGRSARSLDSNWCSSMGFWCHRWWFIPLHPYTVPLQWLFKKLNLRSQHLLMVYKVLRDFAPCLPSDFIPYHSVFLTSCCSSKMTLVLAVPFSWNAVS